MRHFEARVIKTLLRNTVPVSPFAIFSFLLKWLGDFADMDLYL